MINQKSLTMKGEIIKPVFLTALIIRDVNGTSWLKKDKEKGYPSSTSLKN